MPTASTFFEHLTTRGLFDTNRLRYAIDIQEEIITFPLYTPIGYPVGYQRYDWRAEKKRCNQGRYYSWISPPFRPLAFWGMEYFAADTIIVTEGIWDAIRAIGAGYNAIAILTATPSKEFVRWFRMITQYKETIAVLDNDENNAGKALAKLCSRAIMCSTAKDLGDMTPTQAKEFLSNGW